ncbi:MAG: hypothetical protein ABIQ81_03065 [Novosphingobium sp.]
MRYRNLVALAAPLALMGTLAACEKAETPTVEPSASPAILESAPAASAANTIPLAVQGRWGLVPADCTSTAGDNKGLVTIDATTLKFYESRATLGAIKDVEDDGIEATFAFTGEGQNWTLDVNLDVEDGGKTLIRKETGRDASPGPLKYTRCA